MTVLLSLLGGLFSRIVDLLQLALVYWRIVLPVVLIALLWLRIESLEADLADAQQLHYDYIAQVSIGSAKRQATLVEQARQAEAFMDDTGKAHAVTILKLQDYFNAKIKANSASHVRSAADLRSQLRIALDAQAYAARRPTDTAESHEGPSSIGGDGNSTDIRKRLQKLHNDYATLEIGCAITTQDYNTLAKRVERMCQIYSCIGIDN